MLDSLANVSAWQMQFEFVKIEQRIFQSSQDFVQVWPRLLSWHVVACHVSPA